MIKKLFPFALILSIIFPQDWYYPGYEICIKGQDPVLLKNIQIINRGENNWTSKTKIKIEFNQRLKATLNLNHLSLFVKKGQNLKKMKYAIDATGHILTIYNLPRISPGTILSVSGIYLQDFSGFSLPTQLQVNVNGQNGRCIGNLKEYSKWIRKESGRIKYLSDQNNYFDKLTRSLRDSLITVFDGNYYRTYYRSLVKRYQMNGYFSILDVDAYLETTYQYFPDSEEPYNILPEIVIDQTQGKRIFKKGNQINISLPKDLTIKSRNIQLLPKNKIDQKKVDNNLLILSIIKNLKKDEHISISNLRFSSQTPTNSEPINIEIKISPVNPLKKIRTLNTIAIGTANFIMSEDIQLIANGELTPVPPLHVYNSSGVFPLNEGDSLSFQIPDSINAFWDYNPSTYRLKGDGAQYISQEPSLNNGKKSITYRVNKTIPSGSQISFQGLNMYAKYRTGDTTDIQSLHSPINCNITSRYQKKKFVTKKEIRIVEIKMYQIDNHSLIVNDENCRLAPIKIEVNCDYPAFSNEDRFRIEIPEELSMNWSLANMPLKITGPSKQKIKQKIQLDSRDPNSIFISLNSSFKGKESFILRGLLVTDLKRASRGNLRLYLNDGENELTIQQNEVLIQAPNFYTNEDQILFIDDGATLMFNLNINVKHLVNYFAKNDQFSIRIPDNSPVTFNKSIKQVKVNNKLVSSLVLYPNNKQAKFTIDGNLNDNSVISITGLQYNTPSGLTIDPDTLELFVENNTASIGPFFCNNTYDIVNKKAEYKQAQYYYTLINSNFYKGDTIKLVLSVPKIGMFNLDWDTEKIEKNFQFIIKPQAGKISDPIAINDSTIGFLVSKTLAQEDLFRIHGLYIKKPYTPRYCYLKLEYRNFYGEHRIILNQPIVFNTKGQLGKYPTPPLFPQESYTEPLMYYVDEKGHRIRSNDRITKYINDSFNKKYSLPDLEIQNGELTPEDKSVYTQYRSSLSFLNNYLKNKKYTKAIEKGRTLIKTSPNYWEGYYKLSEALLKEGKLKSESRDYYYQAKNYGYIPNSKYPALYKESIDDQAGSDILVAKQKIKEANYIEAEEILMSILDLPDSLDQRIRSHTYYLLGDSAIDLNDCDYARQYYFRSSQYAVGNDTAYSLLEARSKVLNCVKQNENAIPPNFISISSPVGDIPDTKQNIDINFITDYTYPYKLNIRDVNISQVSNINLGDTLNFNEERVYSIDYHPIKEEIFDFSIILSFILTIFSVIS